MAAALGLALGGLAGAATPKPSNEQLLDAAARYALKDDTSCVRGPPELNQELPGLRYGASLEIRPQLLILPCPCAGGIRRPATSTDEGALGLDGLWTTAWVPPASGSAAAVPPTGPAFGLEAHPAAGSAAFRTPGVEGDAAMPAGGREAATSFGLFDMLGRTLRHSLGIPPPYHAGTEPYAADYGCARGYRGGGSSGPLEPGKRWWDKPRWATWVVATPCPCAWDARAKVQGAGTGVSAAGGSHAAAAGIGDEPPLPAWQREPSTMLGCVGPLAVGLAARAPVWVLRQKTRRAYTNRHSRSAAFL